MNDQLNSRRDFIRKLAIGAASIPVFVGAFASEPKRKTLLDWCENFRQEHMAVRIDVGMDALEYLRREYAKFDSFPKESYYAKFIIEKIPFRCNADGSCFVEPSRIWVGDDGNQMIELTDRWKGAPNEAAIGYSLTTNEVFGVIYDRTSFEIVKAQQSLIA